MRKSYELLYGFLHCTGRTSYSAGYVDTEKEAREWVKSNQSSKKYDVPPEDPVRTCPVRGCPAKVSGPWYEYREVER